MQEFTFEVFTNRWNSTVTYKVRKTKSGWYVAHKAINGDCQPDGTPYFIANFDQDYIDYPSSFGNYMEWLWEQADQKAMSGEEIQEKLQELAEWVSTCERTQPQWEGWNV